LIYAARNGNTCRMTSVGPGLGALLPPIRLLGHGNPRFALDSVGGLWVLVIALPSATDPSLAALEPLIARHRRTFDDEHAALFLLTKQPEDLTAGRLRDRQPGIRSLADTDGAGFAALGLDAQRGGALLFDPMLRLFAYAHTEDAARLVDLIPSLPSPSDHAGVTLHAPILQVPRVFEPDFCRALIAHYEAEGGRPSGVMRMVDGQTRLVEDLAFKRRSDVVIADPGLRDGVRRRLAERLVPSIERAFAFRATRLERYLVACYDAETGGHFRPHRDNTTPATAHRRFAVTVNLDATAHDGGDLRFPEFGERSYRAPTGGAVVFSASLLHEVTPVTAGRRFACLPFLFDEAAASLRKAPIAQ
jgi:predicted 2-oxoglutarate/Fe(II)-dependent dioxygenase YbiX